MATPNIDKDAPPPDDMAAEMAEYTKLSVINQAATAMLAQANQLPQNVLKLLQ